MTSARSPVHAVSDEVGRLARLQMLAVMDTEPEPIFESLARLASLICETPIALVSLLDGERQWFKAKVGLLNMSQTERKVAFCTYAIGGDDLMEVCDATQDPRFIANPMVTGEPNIRFYAGVPLVMPDGERLGTLCVLDQKRRSLSDVQRAALQELAAAVTHALLLREQSYYPEIPGEEDRFRLISEGSPLGIFQADAAGFCVYSNPRWREIYGLSRAQSLGESWREVIHPEDRAGFLLGMKRAIHGGEVFAMEYRLLRQDQQVVHVHATARAASWGEPAERGFIGTVEDITARKQSEERLRATNSFLDRAERIAGVGGWEVDLIRRSVKWTAQNRRIYELAPDFEPTFEDHLKYFDREGQRQIRSTASLTIESGQPWDLELAMVTAKGRSIWTRSVGVVEYENGVAVRLVGTLQDITAKKAAEQALLMANGLLENVLANLPCGLSVFDGERRLIAQNSQFRQLLNLPETLFEGTVTTVESIIEHDAVDGKYGAGPLEEIVGTILDQARAPTTHHFLRTRSDGVTLDIRGAPMPGGGFVTTYVDVSAARASEIELREAKAAAELANQAKTTFLAAMSHEIRTPLNGIVGITKLLLDENLTPSQAQLGRLIDGSAQSLMVLVNDFLDLAKIDAGQTVLELIPFDLDRLLTEVAELFNYRASAKSLKFKFWLAPDAPTRVWGDPTRLRQILNNLLGNALKFTQAGEVAFSVSVAARAEAGFTLRFTVTDTGIGISASVQEKLFGHFVQADSSTTREYGGTGLGLAIVKQLSHLMGGYIELESQEGQGSTFVFVLPEVLPAPMPLKANELAEACPVACPVGAPASGHVLLVEDNPTNQIVAMGILRKLGYADVTVVVNGLEALQALSRNTYAVILMDCQMPVMDGYMATRALRARGCLTPVIAMTANVMAGDVAKCMDAGMNDYVAKPVTPASLQRGLANWIPVVPRVSGPSNAVSPQHNAAELPVFDVALALDRLGGDASLLLLVLQSFKDRIPLVIHEIEAALRDNAITLLQGQLHSLLGSSGAVSASQLQQRVEAMSQCLNQGDMASLRQQLPQLKLDLQRFLLAADAAVL